MTDKDGDKIPVRMRSPGAPCVLEVSEGAGPPPGTPSGHKAMVAPVSAAIAPEDLAAIAETIAAPSPIAFRRFIATPDCALATGVEYSFSADVDSGTPRRWTSTPARREANSALSRSDSSLRASLAAWWRASSE